ncbi:MAG TPA: mechanosensitive ion channel domain-containing protein [Rhizomicrobium sp.]|nr:mechanosensitive ion channel domain-containing protein [Rhizomicrobium sp.]
MADANLFGDTIPMLEQAGRAALARILSPPFAFQAILVVAVAILGILLRAPVRHRLTQFVYLVFPKAWGPPLARAFGSVAAPLFWLAVLFLAELAAEAMGWPFGLVNAAVALLAAWVSIRILSHTVRSPLWSGTISVVAWSIAALSILGLLGPVSAELDASAIHLGNLRISGLVLVRAVFLLAALLWGTAVLRAFLERRIVRTATLTPSIQALLVQCVRIVLPALAIVVALASVGVDLTALTVLSGALGIGVGLGLQRTVANFVAGLSLILSESIRPGDIIEYQGSYGWVTSMSARYVGLRTRDGIEYLVPNDYFLEHGVENWSHSDPKLRLRVPVGIAYESDLDLARKLCVEAARAAPRVLERPEPVCLLTGFGDSSVNLEIRAWIEDPRNGTGNVRSDILLGVWARFHKAGIVLPFPQRDVHIVPPPQA